MKSLKEQNIAELNCLLTWYNGIKVFPTIERGSLIAKSDMIHPPLSFEGVRYIYATPLRTKGFK